jgi:hypothetical protein
MHLLNSLSLFFVSMTTSTGFIKVNLSFIDEILGSQLKQTILNLSQDKCLSQLRQD